MAAKEEIAIAGVRLTSPDKVLYPEQGTTKRDLAEYYLAVADHILPHVARRPITLVRCPTGRQKKCFYQRHAGSGVVPAAREVRAALADLGLVSFVKTTGGKGLHVVAPIERRHEWREVKAFAKKFAESLASAAPDRYLTRVSKAERRGRIFIDYLRNDPTSTVIAPYSTRARAGAPVATPIAWEELAPGLDPKASALTPSPGG